MPIKAPEIHALHKGQELNADEYNALAVCLLKVVEVLNDLEAEKAGATRAPATAKKTASK